MKLRREHWRWLSRALSTVTFILWLSAKRAFWHIAACFLSAPVCLSSVYVSSTHTVMWVCLIQKEPVSQELVMHAGHSDEPGRPLVCNSILPCRPWIREAASHRSPPRAPRHSRSTSVHCATSSSSPRAAWRLQVVQTQGSSLSIHRLPMKSFSVSTMENTQQACASQSVHRDTAWDLKPTRKPFT